MTAQSVWRATTDQPATVMLEHEAELDAWLAEIEAYRTELFGQPDDPDTRPDAMSVRYGVRHEFVGWSRGAEDRAPGWRWDAHSGAVVPRRGSKAGQTAAARLDALQPPRDPRTRFEGMPSRLNVGMRLCSPGVEQLQGELYAVWAASPEQVAQQAVGRDAIDPGLWEPVKMSAYWIRREAQDRDDAAAVSADA